MTDEYVLGHTSVEAHRLQLQADVLAPHSAHLFRLAGIEPGMRVLDIGSGAGDVSMLLAELVGPTGSVTGVDINPDIVELARARTADAGLANVCFTVSDLAELRLDEPFDALVGRLILIHLPAPAATVRGLSRLVRPGGVVSFQDFNITRCRSVPPTPLATRCAKWVADGMHAVGINVDIGEQLAAILRDAGLTVEGMAAAGPGGTAGSAMPEYAAMSVGSMLPVLLAHGIATEAEVGLDTLAQRLTSELAEAGATFWGPEMAGAWARVR